jgi:hypothetical protein
VSSCEGLSGVKEIIELHEESELGVILLSVDYEYDFIVT